MRRTLITILSSIALATAGGSVAAQEPATTPDEERALSWLFVLDAASASFDGSTLSLADVGADVLLFTDRPERRVTRMPTSEFVTDWDILFAEAAPNAALAWDADGSRSDAAVELNDPLFDGDRLSFTVTPLTEIPSRVDSLIAGPADDVPVTMNAVDLFIDSSSTGTVTMTFRMCGHLGMTCLVPPPNVIDAMNAATSHVVSLSKESGYIHPASDGSVVVPTGAGLVSADVVPACESTETGYTPTAEWVTVIDWVHANLNGSNACPAGSLTGPVGPSTFECSSDWTTVIANGTIDCTWEDLG